MDEEFQTYVEAIQKKNNDANITKKYMLLVKKTLIKFIGSEDDTSGEECIIQFLESYGEDLKKDPFYTLKNIYILSQYNSYKELLNIAKGNQAKLNRLLEIALKKEAVSNKEDLNISLDKEEQVMRSLRDVIRSNPKIKGKDLISVLQKRKAYVADRLKSNLIASIQQNISFLEEFGILDEYIEFANETMKKLDLQELTIYKRGIPADEYGDGHGNTIRFDQKRNCFVKYNEEGREIASGEELDEYYEDYGVIDMLDEEYLKTLSPEDLTMMDMFWRAKYLEERMEISKAIHVIRSLYLWDEMLENDESLEEIDDKKILEALSTYSKSKKQEKIEPPKKRFLGKKKNKEPEEETTQENKEEIEFLARIARDLVLQECIIVSKLKAKDFSVRGWGTIEVEGDLEEDRISLAIDNANFRGTVLMAVPRSALNEFLGTTELKLPKYKNIERIDGLYSEIMARLYLPASNFFKKEAIKKFKKNLGSLLLAGITGKKPKTEQNQNGIGEKS